MNNITKQERYNRLYMDIAFRVSQMSYCKRLQVGAIAVKDGRIISMGWNGRVAGVPNNCEDKNGYTFDSVLHAESNLLAKLAQSTESSVGSEVYVTHSPCIHCAKIIAQTGIKKVYYVTLYRCSKGIEHLEQCNVEVEQIKIEQ